MQVVERDGRSTAHCGRWPHEYRRRPGRAALSAETHCAQTPTDLCIVSCNADEEKERRRVVFIQAAAWRDGGAKSVTRGWISEADVASRFATNTRVRPNRPFRRRRRCRQVRSNFDISSTPTTTQNILPQQTVNLSDCSQTLAVDVSLQPLRRRHASVRRLPVALDNAGRLHGWRSIVDRRATENSVWTAH